MMMMIYIVQQDNLMLWSMYDLLVRLIVLFYIRSCVRNSSGKWKPCEKTDKKKLMVLLADFVKWSILGNSLICVCAGSGSGFRRTPQDRGRAAAANTTRVILFSLFIMLFAMMSFITNCC